MNKTISDEF
jgi:hypothetical protein